MVRVQASDWRSLVFQTVLEVQISFLVRFGMVTSIQRLVAYHDIAQVKYRYMRALDTQDWELMRGCFSQDARAWYSSGKYITEGRDAIVDLLKTLVPTGSFVGSHIALHPELELSGPDRATGVWRLQDIVHFLDNRSSYDNFEIMTGAGYYYDSYIKIEGKWLISSTGYERIFEHCEQSAGRSDFKLLVNPGLGRRGAGIL
jgi:hypothetical protein